MPAINQIVDTVPLQKSGGTGLDIFSASLADGAGKVVDSGGSTIFSWDENGNITANGLPRVLHTNVTPVGNVGAGEDDLMSYTLPANTLKADGDTIRVYGTFATSAADDGEVRFYFGGTSRSSWVTSNTSFWVAFVITRTSSSTARISRTSDANPQVALTQAITGLDFTATNVIKFTGEAVNEADNDVTQSTMQIKYEPAPQ